MKNKPILFLASFFLIFLSCIPGTNGVLRNSSNEMMRWRTVDFPLEVASSEALPQWMRENLQDGISEWNYQTGRTVFVLRDDIPWNSTEFFTRHRGTIYVQSSDLEDMNGPNSLRGETLINNVGRYYTDARLNLDVALPPQHAILVMVHELGHCLGLAHDTYRPSVMYRYAEQSGGRIMDDDINFVRWQMETENNE